MGNKAWNWAWITQISGPALFDMYEKNAERAFCSIPLILDHCIWDHGPWIVHVFAQEFSPFLMWGALCLSVHLNVVSSTVLSKLVTTASPRLHEALPPPSCIYHRSFQSSTPPPPTYKYVRVPKIKWCDCYTTIPFFLRLLRYPN